jgi:hypothetical protein
MCWSLESFSMQSSIEALRWRTKKFIMQDGTLGLLKNEKIAGAIVRLLGSSHFPVEIPFAPAVIARQYRDAGEAFAKLAPLLFDIKALFRFSGDLRRAPESANTLSECAYLRDTSTGGRV